MKKILFAVLALLCAGPLLAASTVNPGTSVAVTADEYRHHKNATVTTSSSVVVTGIAGRQVDLIVNVKAAPTGTTPTLTFSLQAVDPQDSTTVIGSAVTGATISGITSQVLNLPGVESSAVKISWTVTGTTPSFTQVYSTLRAKGATGMIGQTTTARSQPVTLPSDWSEPDLAPAGSQNQTLAASGAFCSDASINSCGAGSTVALAIAGYPGASVQINNSTFTCTVKADITGADTTKWSNVSMISPTGQIVSSIAFSADSTSSSYSIVAPTGTSQVRLRCSTSPTNTSSVSLRATFSLGLQAVVDLVANSSASNTISTACTDANINSCATTAVAQIPLAGQFGVGVTIPASSTLASTLRADCSWDDGTTWKLTSFDDGPAGALYTTVSGTAYSMPIFGCAGATHARVRAATVTSGTGLISLHASFAADPHTTLYQRATYAAANSTRQAIVVTANSTFGVLCGSATKVVRLQQVLVSATVATAAAYLDIVLRKTSGAPTAGTAVTLTKVPMDSLSPAASANLAQLYSAAPTAGTAVGNIQTQLTFGPITGTPAATAPPLEFKWRDQDSEAPTLRGTAQCVEVALGGTAPANAPSVNVTFKWTEE
jgi:hypothetical protein